MPNLIQGQGTHSIPVFENTIITFTGSVTGQFTANSGIDIRNNVATWETITLPTIIRKRGYVRLTALSDSEYSVNTNPSQKDIDSFKASNGYLQYLTTSQSSLPDITGVVASTESGGFVLPNGEFADTAFRREYLISNYGKVSQAKAYTCAITAGSNDVSVSGYLFTESDVGKTFSIAGAGVVSTDYAVVANDGVYLATIQSVTSGTGSAVLSVPATTTVVSADCLFGFPIDGALTAAISQCKADYAVDKIPGKIVVPPGRYIATKKQKISSGVAFGGVGRDISQVFFLNITSNADDSTISGFISRSDTFAVGGYYSNVDVVDITLNGTYFAASSPYGSDMKMLHMNNTSDTRVQRVKIVNNPSTAIGYDMSYNLLIADNIILNGGRLAKPTANHGSAGGSAIGIAIGDASVGDVGIIIRNNFISGKWTKSGGTGRSGINIEAASNIASPPSYYGGFIVEGNIIQGYYNGIVDSGGYGTSIQNNMVRLCTHGIKSGTNGISVGRSARDAIIVGNRVSKCFTPDPGVVTNSYAIGISVYASGTDTGARTLVSSNMVSETDGYGIQVYGGAVGTPVRNCTVSNNHVFDNGLSGIRVVGTVLGLDIMDNQISGNGRLGTAGNKAPILVAASTTWTDGRLQNNTYTDYQTTPTQDATHSISGSAVLTNVRISGNTGDAS